MSTKMNPRSKAIHSAWRNARSAWRRTETSVGALLSANKALIVSLGSAGAAAARRTRRELEAAMKSLARNGREARQKFESFAHEHAVPVRARAVRKPAVRARKRSA